MSTYNLKVGPAQVDAALAVLRTYVLERAQLLKLEEGQDHCQITVAGDAIRMMDALFQFKEQLQEMVKTPTEAAYDSLRFTIVPRLMTDEGIPKMTIAGVGRVNLQDDVQVKVLDQEGLKKWLVDSGFEDMIKPTVNAGTLAAFCRRRLKDGEDMPDKTEVKPIVRAVITRAGV